VSIKDFGGVEEFREIATIKRKEIVWSKIQ